MVRLLDIAIPLPQLKPVPPYIVPKKQTTGPATANGFETEVPAAKGIVSDIKQLKAWQVRFNHLPSQALRFLIDPHINTTSHQYLAAAAKLKKNSARCRSNMLSPGPAKKPTWWARMVAAEVTHHDFYAYLTNLYRAVVLRTFVPAGESAAEKAHREARRLQYDAKFRELCAAWRAKLEKDISDRQQAIRTGATHSSLMDDMHEDTIALRKAEIDTLEQFMQGCRSQKPIAKALLQPKVTLYKAFSSLMVSQFWQERWTKEIAYNTYARAASAIAIVECATTDGVGDIMSNTFQICADMTWQHVMAPRLENIELRRHSSREWIRNHPLPENKDAVYDAYKDAASPWEDEAGIEMVLVPVVGSSITIKKRKAQCDDYINDMPLGKRIR